MLPNIVTTALWGALLLCSAAWAGDDVLDPLRDSIAAAPLVVEGEAERGYTTWDGADPNTISTYTPFRVDRVLKGVLPERRIVLRQPGGDVQGVSLPTRRAEFEAGESAIVLLGGPNPGDGSFDVLSGRRGKFSVRRDESGRAVLDVRLGADASAYDAREKAPGTLLTRIPLEIFEQLALAAVQDRTADPPVISAPPPSAGSVAEVTPAPPQPAAHTVAHRPTRYRLWVAVSVGVGLLALAWWAARRGGRT